MDLPRKIPSILLSLHVLPHATFCRRQDQALAELPGPGAAEACKARTVTTRRKYAVKEKRSLFLGEV